MKCQEWRDLDTGIVYEMDEGDLPEEVTNYERVKQSRFVVQHCWYMPAAKRNGVLYVSRKWEVAIHLCACGCGEETVTPIGAGGWTFTEDPEGPTLSPSIGNHQFECRSHYYIRNGNVVWA